MRNICCHYISSCIIKNKYCHCTSSCTMTIFIFIYKRNICCHYIRGHIMTTNILIIIILYNEKYTSSRIMRTTLSCIMKIFVHYISSYIIKNKYFHYTLSCIREIITSSYIVFYNENYAFMYN